MSLWTSAEAEVAGAGVDLGDGAVGNPDRRRAEAVEVLRHQEAGEGVGGFGQGRRSRFVPRRGTRSPVTPRPAAAARSSSAVTLPLTTTSRPSPWSAIFRPSSLT